MFQTFYLYKFSTFILLFLFIVNNLNAAEKTFICATTHYPPYTIYDNKDDTFSGLDMLIINPLFKQLNVDIEVVNLPWARLKQEIKKNTYDCYFSLAKYSNREEFLEYSNLPTHITTIAIFHSDDISSVDFSNKNIGVHRGITVPNDILPLYGLHEANFKKLQSNEILFQMLYRKRVDAVMTNKIVGEHILKTQYEGFFVNALELKTYKIPVYLAFKKGVVDIDKVNNTLFKILNPVELITK